MNWKISKVQPDLRKNNVNVLSSPQPRRPQSKASRRNKYDPCSEPRKEENWIV